MSIAVAHSLLDKPVIPLHTAFMTTQAVSLFAASAAADARGGIYHLQLDPDRGRLSRQQQAVVLPRAGFLCRSPDGAVLYATAKVQGDAAGAGGAVNAFRVDAAAGGLSWINHASAGEADFCHISTARQGSLLLAADYHHAMAAVFPVGPGGALQSATATVRHAAATHAVPDRQDHPHVHSINPDRSDRYALVCDFSADQVAVYKLGRTGTLSDPTLADTAAGDGPRHLVCAPGGKVVYVIHELSSCVMVCAFDPESGVLRPGQRVSTLPEGFTGGNTAAELLLSADQRFLYASNRGHDSVAWFRVDPVSGALSRQGVVPSAGEHPRNMRLDPTGRFLLVANRFSDSIAVFRLASDSGAPELAGEPLPFPEPMGMVPC